MRAGCVTCGDTIKPVFLCLIQCLLDLIFYICSRFLLYEQIWYFCCFMVKYYRKLSSGELIGGEKMWGVEEKSVIP